MQLSAKFLQKLGFSLAMCALIGSSTQNLFAEEVTSETNNIENVVNTSELAAEESTPVSTENEINVEENTISSFEEIESEIAATESTEQSFFAAKIACLAGLLTTVRTFFSGLCITASEKVATGLEKVGLKKEIRGCYLHTWVASVAGALGLKILAQKKENSEDEKKLNNGSLAQDAAVVRNVVLKAMIDEYHAKVSTYKNALLHNTKGININDLKLYIENLKNDIITLYHARQSYWERAASFLQAICPFCEKESSVAGQ